MDDHRDLLLLLRLDFRDGGVDLHLLLLEREPLQALLKHLRLARLELRRRVLAAELDVHLGLQLAPQRRRSVVLQAAWVRESERGGGAEGEEKKACDHCKSRRRGARRSAEARVWCGGMPCRYC